MPVAESAFPFAVKMRDRFGKGGSQIFRLRFRRQWQDEADEGNAEFGNTWAFTAEGTENILASSANQSPDPCLVNCRKMGLASAISAKSVLET